MKSRIAKLSLVLAVYTLSGCSGIGVGALVGPAIGGAMLGEMVRDYIPVNYHGQAEKEIKSGKYDPKL